MGSNDTYIVPKGAATLTGGGHSGGLHSDMTVIRHKRGRNKGVRRLTEIECERLQGFPDNWTQYGNYDGVIKPIAKTQRYMLIGNAVTVDIVELIAKRLKFIVDENIPIRTDKWDGAKLYP